MVCLGRLILRRVRDFPEYPYNIAQIQANIVWVLKSRKTYSRYLKKIPPSENLLLFGVTQYLFARKFGGAGAHRGRPAICKCASKI